jgi:hypothetical protein
MNRRILLGLFAMSLSFGGNIDLSAARPPARQWLLQKTGKSSLLIKHKGREFRHLKIPDLIIKLIPNPRYPMTAVLAAKKNGKGSEPDYIYFVDLPSAKKQRLRLGRGNVAWLVSEDGRLWSPGGDCMQVSRLGSDKKKVWRPDGVVLARVDELRNWLTGAPWQSTTLVNKKRSSEFLGWAAECSPAIRSGDPAGYSVYWWFDAKRGRRQVIGKCAVAQRVCAPRQALMRMVLNRK